MEFILVLGWNGAWHETELIMENQNEIEPEWS
jgi:hypothetical protein